jgi:hypothetical protein
MDLRYLRIRLFYGALERVSAWARRRRMAQMAWRVRLEPGKKVLDLGGLADTWRNAPGPLEVTVLNLPGADVAGGNAAHRFTFVEGDACNVGGAADKSYDIVFSNSVIEHVGDEAHQEAFAREVRRLGCSYWVQTPAIWFPVEAHTGMPFWWFYPEALRRRLLRSWQRKLPEWTEMVRGTRVLTRERVQQLFPEAEIYVERVCGIPKSYTAWYSARS